VSSTGNLFVQTSQVGANITVGDNASSVANFSISSAELNRFQAGFNSVTVGRTDGTGTVLIGDTSLNNPTIFLSGGTAGHVTLDTSRTLTTNNKNLTFHAGTGDSGIFTTQAGSSVVGGSSNITIIADDVVLNTSSQTAIATTGNVNIYEATNTRPIALGAATSAGNLSLSNTELNQFSGVSVMTIGSSNNTNGANIVVAGPINTTAATSVLSLVTNGTSSITQTAASTITAPTLNVTTGSGAITLTLNNPVNNVSLNSNSGDIGFTANSSLNILTSAAGSGNLTVTANNTGDITYIPPSAYQNIPKAKSAKIIVGEAAKLVIDYIKAKMAANIRIQNFKRFEFEAIQNDDKKKLLELEKIAKENPESPEDIEDDLSKYLYDLQTIEMLASFVSTAGTKDVNADPASTSATSDTKSVKEQVDNSTDLGPNLADINIHALDLSEARNIVEKLSITEGKMEEKLNLLRDNIKVYFLLYILT
jgi:hypothetical protein